MSLRVKNKSPKLLVILTELNLYIVNEGLKLQDADYTLVIHRQAVLDDLVSN